MNFGKAIKAARSYLDLSQDELAEALGMSQSGIINIERGESDLKKTTREKIENYFLLRGISFEGDGIKIRSNSIVIIDGEGWWLSVLDDVHNSLKTAENKEFLLLYADDKLSPPEVNAKIRLMRADGVKMRQIVQEGNSYLMGDLNEYRHVPDEYFSPRVAAIYVDKYAVCADDNTKAVIFKDISLAEQMRLLFEFVWQSSKAPKKSTADERF